MTRELEKSASYFYLNRISFNDRKPGELGMLYDEHHNLLDVMRNNKLIDWTNVSVITCNCVYERIYTTDNICCMWNHACNLAKAYNFIIIYQLGCTKFVVSPESPVDLMDSIMDKPSFYDNYHYNDLQLYGKFEDFDCNADIVINLALKQVGPISMPRITKQYFEYMMKSVSFKNYVNGLNYKIDKAYKDIAEFKFKTYHRLNEKQYDIVNNHKLSSLDAKLITWADMMYKVINAVFDHYEYFTNRSFNTMYDDNCWYLIIDELNFMFKYYVSEKLNDKSIKCILSILIDIAKENGLPADPFEALKDMRWNDKNYIENVCKNIVKN